MAQFSLAWGCLPAGCFGATGQIHPTYDVGVVGVIANIYGLFAKKSGRKTQGFRPPKWPS
jgi:hypothetical protein